MKPCHPELIIGYCIAPSAMMTKEIIEPIRSKRSMSKGTIKIEHNNLEKLVKEELVNSPKLGDCSSFNDLMLKNNMNNNNEIDKFKSIYDEFGQWKSNHTEQFVVGEETKIYSWSPNERMVEDNKFINQFDDIEHLLHIKDGISWKKMDDKMNGKSNRMINDQSQIQPKRIETKPMSTIRLPTIYIDDVNESFNEDLYQINNINSLRAKNAKSQS
ncbi:hypothetical protein BLOT_014956 [Blomia tropicalis]|nr:hypothetical protein BLOT_014956 [Blomia tropicalis]